MSIVAHKQLPVIHWVRLRKGANPKRFDEHASALLERSFASDKQPVTIVVDKVTCRVDLQTTPYVITQVTPGATVASAAGAPTDDVVERRLLSMIDRALLGKSDPRHLQCACCSRVFGPLVRRRQCAFCTKVCCAGCVARGAVTSTTGATDLDACITCCGSATFHVFKYGRTAAAAGAQGNESATAATSVGSSGLPVQSAAADPSSSPALTTLSIATKGLSVFAKIFADVPERLAATTSEAFCARIVFCLSRLTRTTFWEHPMCVDVRKAAILFHCSEGEICELETHTYTVMARFLGLCRKCLDKSVLVIEALSGVPDEVAVTAIMSGCIYASCLSLPRARPMSTQINLALASYRGIRDPRMTVEESMQFQQLQSSFVPALEVLFGSIAPERAFSLRPISHSLGDWKWSNEGTGEVATATFGCFVNVAALPSEQMHFQTNREATTWCAVQTFTSRPLQSFLACRYTMDDPGAIAVMLPETRFIALASPPARVALHLALPAPWKVLRESTRTTPGPIDVFVSIHLAAPLAEAFVRKYRVPCLTQQAAGGADSEKCVTRTLSEWMQVWFYAEPMPVKPASAQASGGRVPAPVVPPTAGTVVVGSSKDSYYVRPVLLVTGPAGSGKSCAAMYVYAECMGTLHLERTVPVYLDPHRMNHALQAEGGVDRYIARYLGISASSLVELTNEFPVVLIIDSVDESSLSDASFRTLLQQNPIVSKCRIMITCREGHLQIPATIAAVTNVIHLRLQPLSCSEGATLLAVMARLPSAERPPVQISDPSWLTLPIHAKLLAVMIRENFPTNDITSVEELYESFVFLRRGRHRQRSRIVELVVHMARNYWRCSTQEAKRILGTDDVSTLVDGFVALDPTTRGSSVVGVGNTTEPNSEFSLMHRCLGDYVLYSELVRRVQGGNVSRHAADVLDLPFPYADTIVAMYKASKHVTPQGIELVDRVIVQLAEGKRYGRRTAPYVAPPSDFRWWCCSQNAGLATRRSRAVALTTLGRDFLRSGEIDRALKELFEAKAIFETLWSVATQQLRGDAKTADGNLGIETSALHDEFARVLVALTDAYQGKRDLESLLKIRVRMVELMEARYSAESGFVTPFLKDLADTHRRLGNLHLYRQTLWRAIQSLELEAYRDPDHNPRLAQALQELGEHTQKSATEGTGGASGAGGDVLDTADALRLLERCLRVKELTYGENSSSSKYALVSCAIACNKLERYQAAREYLERALAASDDGRGGAALSPSESTVALASLGHSLVGLKLYSDALRQYERALAQADAADPQPPAAGSDAAKLVLGILEGMCNSYEVLGDIASACKCKERVVAFLKRDAARVPTAPKGALALAYSVLASYYSRLANYEEAVAKLKASVRIMSQTVPRRRDDVEATLVRLLNKTPATASGFVVLDIVAQLLLSIDDIICEGRDVDAIEGLFNEILKIAARVT